jgi:hypothetical protein
MLPDTCITKDVSLVGCADLFAVFPAGELLLMRDFLLSHHQFYSTNKLSLVED